MIMIKPLNDNILVKFIEEKKNEENESKIIIFEKEKNEPTQKAEIIACGYNVSDLIKNSAEILINKFAAIKVPYHHENYYLINENDVLVILH